MKTETLYSRADWKYHKNKLGYDDLIDGTGHFIATINVMDMAISDILNEECIENDLPKELFVLGSDGCWSVYIATKWLTPKDVQTALDKLGNLMKRKFIFDPYRLPAELKNRYRQEHREFEDEVEQTGLTSFSWHASPDKPMSKVQNNKVVPSKERLAAIFTHKLKM